MKWINDRYPENGTWCWVSIDGVSFFIAKFNGERKPAWTNEDTWEDFCNEVAYWIPLETPHRPNEQTDWNTLGTDCSVWGEVEEVINEDTGEISKFAKVEYL